ENKADDEKNWHIELDLKGFAHNLLKEDGHTHLAKLRNLSAADLFEVRNQLLEYIRYVEQTLGKIGETALNTVKNAGIEHDKFAGGANGICKYFSYLSQ